MPIKVIMRRDSYGVMGMYFSIIETENDNEFVIGDGYPSIVEGGFPNGMRVHLYSIYPISPKRVILLVSNGAEFAPRRVKQLRDCLFQEPVRLDNNRVKIRVRHLKQEEFIFINNTIIQNSSIGIASKKQITSLL